MGTKMKKQTKPYVFFDQNVMERVYKNKAQYATFQNNVKSLVLKNGKDVRQRLTPFGLLEFVGLKKSELFDIKHKDKNLNEYPFKTYQEVEDFMPCLKQKIQKKINKEFLIERLNKKQQTDLNYLNEQGKSLIDRYIAELSEQPNPSSRKRHIYHSIAQNLFLDRLSQVNISHLSNADKQKVVTSFIECAIGVTNEQRAIGSLRFVCRIYQEMRKDPDQKQWVKNNPQSINTLKEGDVICKELKPQADLVDCELIHLAFFGSNDKHCYCYTTDSKEDIQNRLEFYCFYIDFFIKLFFDKSVQLAGKPPPKIVNRHKKPEWRCGKVFILDKTTGAKITKISTQKIYENIRNQSSLCKKDTLNI